ncbi:MAG: DNA-binding protein [Alphaproteobacteria bacterium]|nr:DNA-binding protein [Alphaproteobacteria bacterium]
MPKQNLASLSVEALLKLRNEIGALLSRKAEGLKKELASLSADYAEVGRIAVYGKKGKTKSKVAAKYRDDKTGITWAGRGAQPVWMREAIKAGKSPDDFLIVKGQKKKAVKKSAKRK